MINRVISIFIVLLSCHINTYLVVCNAENPLINDANLYGGGEGTAEDPYRIYTPEQMNQIGIRPNDWDKHFKLMMDIDLSEYKTEAFNIIGYFVDTINNKPFSGVFDGNNNSIRNFNYTSTDKDYVGIFGYISGVSAQIKNLGLIDPNIHTGGDFVGSLVGWLRNGNLTDCYSKNCRVSGVTGVGGLVGQAFQANMRIFRCYSSGNVSGDLYVGGLVGQIGEGTVTMCYSKADVLGNRNVGGLVGKTADETSAVTDCYATGCVEGDEYAGGFIGQVERGAAFHCYSVGNVSGNRNTGGFTGYIRVLGTVMQCFWDTQTSGQTTSAGGTGKTTEEMKSIGTFTAAGWDFWDIWEICTETNYPVLQWQIPIGDFLCPDGVNFSDFSFFAEHWLENNCTATDYFCRGTDLDQSGSVGFSDLIIFADNWLEGISFIE